MGAGVSQSLWLAFSQVKCYLNATFSKTSLRACVHIARASILFQLVSIRRGGASRKCPVFLQSALCGHFKLLVEKLLNFSERHWFCHGRNATAVECWYVVMKQRQKRNSGRALPRKFIHSVVWGYRLILRKTLWYFRKKRNIMLFTKTNNKQSDCGDEKKDLQFRLQHFSKLLCASITGFKNMFLWYLYIYLGII